MNHREIKDYEKMGACLRLLKGNLSALLRLSSGKVPKSMYNSRIWAIDKELAKISGDLEERMLHDHPEVSNEYLNVFYGPAPKKGNSELEDRLNEYATEIVKTMLN